MEWAEMYDGTWLVWELRLGWCPVIALAQNPDTGNVFVSYR